MKDTQTSSDKKIEIEFSIIPFKHNRNIALQIRKIVSDKEEIKKILEKGFKEEFIPAKLIFKDKLKAYVRCSELGLIEGKEKQLYKLIK